MKESYFSRIPSELPHADMCKTEIPWGPPESQISCTTQSFDSSLDIISEFVSPLAALVIDSRFEGIKEVRKVTGEEGNLSFAFLTGISLAIAERLKFDNGWLEYFIDTLRLDEENPMFPNMTPWKGPPTEKNILIGFLKDCESAKDSDPFKDPKNFYNEDVGQACVLKTFLSLGITILQNADGPNETIKEILKTGSVTSYFKRDGPLTENLLQAAATAFRMKIAVHDIRGDIVKKINKIKPEEGCDVRPIDIIIMDDSLLFVYPCGDRRSKVNEEILNRRHQKLINMLNAMRGNLEKEEIEKLIKDIN